MRRRESSRRVCGLAAQRLSGLAMSASIFCLLLACVACAPPRSSRITIGSKNFTEQVVLGELLSQEIEAVTGQPVDRRFYLAGELYLPAGIGQWAHRRIRGVYRDRVDGDPEAASASGWSERGCDGVATGNSVVCLAVSRVGGAVARL